jgi:hypothetical protein
MVVVGSCVGLRKPGLGVWGQKPETGLLGLSLGMLLEMAVEEDGEMWWCGVDEVVAVVHMCIQPCARGRGWGQKTRNPSHSGLVSVCIWAAAGGGRFCGITGTPAVVSYMVVSGQ